VDVLKNIWLLAARTSQEYLTRDEFYVALRLIAYAQHGIPATEESVNFDVQVGLPRIDPPPLALMPAEVGLSSNLRPEVRAEDIAA